MNYRKVYGGTPMGNESRCDTCAHAHIVKGYAASERITMCDFSYPPLHIPFKVCECSDYMDRRLPDVEDMEKIAWFLRTKSAGHEAGFLTPDQNAKLEEQDQEDDEAA